MPDATTEPAAIWVPIGELRPWIGNPRKNSDAVKAVADSIRKFGFGAPIVARKADRQIIGGHTRLQAARRLGLTHVPVRYLDLSPEDAQLLALADNKLGEIADWDEGMLGRILAELKASNADLGATGFDPGEIDRLLADLNAQRLSDVEEDPVPEPPETPDSVPGTVYELGLHRLLCGDSTQPADLQKVVGDRVSLLWTDPPYNVAYEGSASSILNDNMTRERFRAFSVNYRMKIVSLLHYPASRLPNLLIKALRDGKCSRRGSRSQPRLQLNAHTTPLHLPASRHIPLQRYRQLLRIDIDFRELFLKWAPLLGLL